VYLGFINRTMKIPVVLDARPETAPSQAESLAYITGMPKH